jgi:hypothetical protein
MKSVIVVTGAELDRPSDRPSRQRMGPDGAFITGSDFQMDGGVTASYFFGELAPKETT